MEDEIFYLCDPEKNTECRKSFCYLNALCRISEKHRCRMTGNPDFAKTDEKGNEIVLLRKHCSGDGDSYFYEATEMGKNLITFP